jgi:hypothetical protein
MKEQLRIYTIKPGEMQEWVSEWRASIAPLRERKGFKVLGAWTIDAENGFVWILRYTGERSWEEADKEYYQSPERTAIHPDPARHIEKSETWFIQTEWPDS